MKSLTCEMCGGTELIKQDGYYVCQNCGVKYSLEEAKKMMIEGVVKIDDSSKIENYYSLAKTACNSGNHEEAEKYCNKIIEIDSDYYKAWFLKGVSTGWQSSITDVHFDEAIVYFHKAMQLSPKAKVKELEEQIADEMSKMFLACYYAHCKYYGKFGTEKVADELKQAYIDILEYRVKIVRVLGPLIEMDYILYSEYMYESVKDAYYNPIKRRYGTQPSRYDLLEYEKESAVAVNLLNVLSDTLHEYINNGNDKAKSLYKK